MSFAGLLDFFVSIVLVEVPADFSDLIGMESDASFPGLLVVWFQFC